jgi:PAS domain S-box-containing protein
MKVNGQEFSAKGALRHEREVMTLLENRPDVIFRLDSDLRYIYVSPAVERNAGIRREHFLGKNVLEIRFPGYDPTALDAKCRQALRRGARAIGSLT